MIRDELRQIILDATERAQASQQVPAVAVPDVVVERPSHQSHGDYATSLPLRMARAARMEPLGIASAIATHIALPDSVAAVQVAPPGFLNFHLAPSWLTQQVDTILSAGPQYG